MEDPELVLIVGGIGLAFNLVGLAMFGGGHGHSHGGGGHGHSHNSSAVEDVEQNQEGNTKKPKEKKDSQAEQMNIKGVFLHILADALGSIVV